MKVNESGRDYSSSARPGELGVWLHIIFYFSKVLGEAKLKTCLCTQLPTLVSNPCVFLEELTALVLFLILENAPPMNVCRQGRLKHTAEACGSQLKGPTQPAVSTENEAGSISTPAAVAAQ